MFLFCQILCIKDILNRSSCRYHREYFFVAVDPDINERRFSALNCLTDGRTHLLFFRHADALYAERLSNLDKVCLILENGIGIPFSVEQRLPLAYHAEYVVVDNNLDVWKVLPAHSCSYGNSRHLRC